MSIPDHSKARNGKPEGIEAIEGIWEKVANKNAQKENPGDCFDGCDSFAVGGLPQRTRVSLRWLAGRLTCEELRRGQAVGSL